MDGQKTTTRRTSKAETRQRLVDAARELFREKGYDATSVRSIATIAGVDASLINHYFGGKEALFQAVLDLPVNPTDQIKALLADPSIDTLPKRLAGRIIDIWESPDTGPAMVAVLRRELADPDQIRMMRSFITKALLGPVTAMIESTHPKDAQLRTSLMAAEVIGLMTARHILAIEPIATLPVNQLAQLLEGKITRALSADILSASPERSNE